MYNRMRGFEDYRDNRILMAPPERLLIMLFEGLISNVNNARVAIENGEANVRRKHLRKARDICTELISSLDYDVGGEIALNLHRLYMYVNKQLIDADIHDKIECLDDALRVLAILDDAWRGAIKNVQDARAEDVECSL